ncbi:mannosyltransferase, partial [Borealophlyctis nickersoniae]
MIVLLVALSSIVLLSLLLRRPPPDSKIPHVTILVLGDIGRSPRMQYHALSFAANGFKVDLVGYSGTNPFDSLQTNDNVRIHFLDTPAKLRAGGARYLYVLNALWRVVKQLVDLAVCLLVRVPRPMYVIVQVNPPAIPTLIIAQFVRVLRGTKLIIDWHNFGFSIMALNLGQRSKVVQFAKWYEKTMGSTADLHLCVTKAMADELRRNWGV